MVDVKVVRDAESHTISSSTSCYIDPFPRTLFVPATSRVQRSTLKLEALLTTRLVLKLVTLPSRRGADIQVTSDQLMVVLNSEEHLHRSDVQTMKLTMQDRLLRRELGSAPRYSSIKGLYGDKGWVNDLDIVNELGGHSGCVNALSWSTSGRFLASGSDDQHLNIHSYQPHSTVSPFALTTTVATGHTANIFSVKFMPHSNDRTLLTAAGDAEVRVFDIEFSGKPTQSSTMANIASTGRGRNFQNMYRGVNYLSDGNTNSRV